MFTTKARYLTLVLVPWGRCLLDIVLLEIGVCLVNLISLRVGLLLILTFAAISIVVVSFKGHDLIVHHHFLLLLLVNELANLQRL